jgi:hypothetical protein
MVIGNAIGLQQRNLKRLLAYSSIAPRRASSSSPSPPGRRRARRRCCSICSPTPSATFGAFAVIIVLSRGDDAVTTTT